MSYRVGSGGVMLPDHSPLHIAARLGLPYAFAAHFAPDQMEAAFKIYEREFEPSGQLDEPYKIACLNVICADTDEAAKYLSTTMSQFVLNVVRGGRNKLQPPVDDMGPLWSSDCSSSSTMPTKSWRSANCSSSMCKFDPGDDRRGGTAHAMGQRDFTGHLYLMLSIYSMI